MNAKYTNDTYSLTDADVDKLIASGDRNAVHTIDVYDADGTPVAAWTD